MLIGISAASIFTRMPRKWEASPQSLGDGKKSVIWLKITPHTPATLRLCNSRALTKENLLLEWCVPQTQGQKTDKEKLKEAGMPDLGGGRLTGGGIIWEGQHAGEGSVMCSRAHPHPPGYRVRNEGQEPRRETARLSPGAEGDASPHVHTHLYSIWEPCGTSRSLTAHLAGSS